MTVRVPGARSRLCCLCLLATLAVIAPAQAHVIDARVAASTTAPRRTDPVSTASAPHGAGAVRQSATPASPEARPPRWWGWVLLGRLHPMVVHFPIALLTVAAVIEMLHLLRRRPVPSEAGTYCLAFGVAGALAAVCLGTLNAGNQTVTGEAALALERHQVMGWISTIAATAALGMGQLARRRGQFRTVAAYLGLVLATSAVVGATGHLGGGLVYGQDYLTGVLPWNGRAQTDIVKAAEPTTPEMPASAARAPLTSLPSAVVSAHAVTRHSAPVAAATPAEPAVLAAEVQAAAEAVDFARDVMPIIKETCVECHGPDKVKARLRMDSVEALQKGGKSGALVKPGDPENSLMLRRVLGLDGDDQMPLDKDPLSEKQIDTLRRWIAAGAHYPGAGSQ